MTSGSTGVQKARGFGKLAQMGSIDFGTSEDMWAFIESNKGKKFEFVLGENVFPLWFSIDKTKDEQTVSKRTSKAIALLREHMKQSHSIPDEQLKRVIDGDWDQGLVFYRPAGGGPITRLLDRKRDVLTLHVGDTATSAGLNFDFGSSLTQINSVM